MKITKDCENKQQTLGVRDGDTLCPNLKFATMFIGYNGYADLYECKECGREVFVHDYR